MGAEIQSANKGKGQWFIELYKPEGRKFTKKGYLVVSKDLTQIFKDQSLTKINLIIASQNVAYIELVEEEED